MNWPDPCVPGPGSYDNPIVIARHAKKFSLYSKLKIDDIDLKEKKKGVPGPG